MTTQIVIHLLPQEIDWFEWQIKQLKQGSYYLEHDDNIIIDVTLNLNLVNWETSQLPKQFFIDKLYQIEKLCDWCDTKFDVDEENKCLGCNDKRRDSINSSSSDNILYLDSDLFFTPELLKYIIDAAKIIENEYYVISPQTVRIWDNSWDIITNTKYLSTPANMDIYYNNDPFKVIHNNSESVSVTPISKFKFAGGWFNLFSTKLLKLINIPISLGPYGVDDTYVMVCCSILNQHKYSVQQFILEGTTVIENFKYRCNPYKNFLSLIDKAVTFRTEAQNNLSKEIEIFYKKYNE